MVKILSLIIPVVIALGIISMDVDTHEDNNNLSSSSSMNPQPIASLLGASSSSSSTTIRNTRSRRSKRKYHPNAHNTNFHNDPPVSSNVLDQLVNDSERESETDIGKFCLYKYIYISFKFI